MAVVRTKLRDFSGGLVLTPHEDAQPRNSVRKARNVSLVGGRARYAGTSVAVKSNASIVPDNAFRFKDPTTGTAYMYVEGTSAGVRKLRVDTADTDAWSDVTLPAAINGGATYNPEAATTGTQPAISGAMTANKRATVFMTPPTDGKREVAFVIDRANRVSSGKGQGGLYKLTTPGATTGAQRIGILAPTKGDLDQKTGTSGNIVLTKHASAASKYISAGGVADEINPALATNPAGWTPQSVDPAENPLGANSKTVGVASPAISANALKIVADKNDAVEVEHSFGATLDLTTFSPAIAVASSDEDYIQFYIRVRKPKHVENFEIAFASGSTNFDTNVFSQEVTFRRVRGKERAKLIGLGDLIPVRTGDEGKDTQTFLGKSPVFDTNSQQLKDKLFQGSVGYQDLAIAKNAWTRVRIPKSQFNESGTPGWSDIRAVRFTVEANEQGRAAIFVDDLKLVGGVGMVGTYQYTFTLLNSTTGTRSNPNISKDGKLRYVTFADVERHGVTIALGANGYGAWSVDPQADRLEVWRTVGNGKAYFKAGELTISGGSVPVVSFTDKTADYYGLSSSAQNYTDGNYTGYGTLDGSLELPIDNDSPNDPSFAFQDGCGPHVGRMWWTRNIAKTDVFGDAQDGEGNVYFSPQGRYESIASFVQVSTGRTDPVQKIVTWAGRLFALTSTALYEIAGADEPFVAIKVEGAPGTTAPNTVVSSLAGITWVGPDGIYHFAGSMAQNVTDPTLLPLFRWREATEDFSASIDYFTDAEGQVGRNSYWLQPKANGAGGESFILIYEFEGNAWRYRDPTRFLWWDWISRRMLGTRSGNIVHDLERVPNDNTGVADTMTLKTSTLRIGPGQYGILRKLFTETDGAGESITVNLVTDGSSASIGTIAASSGRVTTEFNLNTSGVRFAIELSVPNCNNPVEIYGVEAEVYVPDDTAQDSGLGGNS